MIIEAWNPTKHMFMLSKILRSHKVNPPKLTQMPQYGFVAIDDSAQIIASAFIRRVEGGFCQLDGLATDPEKDPVSRNTAINCVLMAVYLKAKELGYKEIMAFSMDNSTLLRSERHGFVKLPHALIALDLNLVNGKV